MQSVDKPTDYAFASMRIDDRTSFIDTLLLSIIILITSFGVYYEFQNDVITIFETKPGALL